MLGDMWSSSELTSEKLGITEIKLLFYVKMEYSNLGFIGKAPHSVRKNLGNPKRYTILKCAEK